MRIQHSDLFPLVLSRLKNELSIWINILIIHLWGPIFQALKLKDLEDIQFFTLPRKARSCILKATEPSDALAEFLLPRCAACRKHWLIEV